MQVRMDPVGPFALLTDVQELQAQPQFAKKVSQAFRAAVAGPPGKGV